jgi:hypothetical protein
MMKRGIYLLVLMMMSFEGYSQFDPVPSYFRVQRALPLVTLNTTQTIMVSDYGANVNDGIDDIPGITAAINAAVNLGSIDNPVALVFDNGTYDLMPTSDTHALSMTDATGVLWDGQNAEFIVHNPEIGFLKLLRSTNTILKDFSVDYATLPFTQGVITEVNPSGGFFNFQVDSGFPQPTSPLFMNSPQRWGMIKNSKGGIKEGTRNLIPHNLFFESVGTNTYKYGNQSSNTLSKIEVGDYFVHIARNNGRTIILNVEGKNLTYMNITGYASPAGGFNSRNSEEWNVINCKIKLKIGRVHTLNADAMHINGGKIGPWVENSLFEGYADDFMNIKHSRLKVIQIDSPAQITVENFVEVNDVVEFYNPRDGIYLGDATVNSVLPLGSNQFQITLSTPINLTTTSSTGHQRADQGYIDNKSNESLILRNNVIRNSRRYGVLIQSKYALIENNTFQNLSGSAIRIENGVDWGEGFRAKEIEIRNNIIDNCGYDKTYIDELNSAAISVDFAKVQNPCSESMNFCGTETANWQGHNDIRIIDNTILYNRSALYLKNITNIAVENNFMCHRDEDITLEESGAAPIEITNLNNSNYSFQSYNYELPNANLHFTLDETSTDTDITNTGTNQDVSLQINTNGGTITQGFIDPVAGNCFDIDTNCNGELRLVNTSDNSNFPGATQGEARTFAFWVKPDQLAFQTFLYSGGPTSGEIFAIQMQANGQVRATDTNGNFVRMEDMPLDVNQWNHITVTVPENNTIHSVQLYKNGIPSEEYRQGSDKLIDTANNVVDFFTLYNGLAKDIRYFDYKLCGGEVEDIYNDSLDSLSIEENIFNNQNKIRVFPSPTTSMLNFNSPVSLVEVYDIQGKLLLTKQEENFLNLDVSNLSSGLYILKINNSQSTKFIKK